jgi:hypothetical protein
MALALIGAASKPPTVQRPKPTPDNHHQVDEDEGHPPRLIDPAQAEVIEALRVISRQQETARQQDQANEKRWWPPSPSWAIVYVTIAYVMIALFQLVAIHRQANIADRTLKLVERPYLGFRVTRVFWQEAVGMEHIRVRVNYSLMNSGRTPARITDHNSILCRTSSRERPQEAPYDENAQQRITGLTITAGREHEASIWLQLPKSEAKIIQLGIEGTSAFVHFFTYVDYKDGLGKPHSSYLCGIVVTGRRRERELYLTFPRSHQYKEDT